MTLASGRSSSSAAAPPAGWRRPPVAASSTRHGRDHAGRIRGDRHRRRRRGDDPADHAFNNGARASTRTSSSARPRARSSSASSSSTGARRANSYFHAFGTIGHDLGRDRLPPLLAARRARRQPVDCWTTTPPRSMAAPAQARFARPGAESADRLPTARLRLPFRRRPLRRLPARLRRRRAASRGSRARSSTSRCAARTASSSR